MAESHGDFQLAEQVYTELIERVRHDAPESELVGLYKILGQLALSEEYLGLRKQLGLSTEA